MPREIIRSASVSPWRVKVGWGRDMEVQLGVESDDETSLFWRLLTAGDDTVGLERLGARMRSILVPVTTTIPEPGISGSIQTTSSNWSSAMANITDVELARAVLNELDVHCCGIISGLWADLDRRGCNDLIRVLRRARDSAFGRDE